MPGFQHDRVGRRNAPALALQGKRVGWCADFGTHAVGGLIRPGLRTGGIGPHGVIAVQADGHAEAARQRLCRRQLPVGQPLQIQMKLHLARIFAREALGRALQRIAVLLRPAQPAGRATPGGVKMAVERIEQRMHLQPAATRGDERAEIRRTFAVRPQVPLAEVAIQQSENLELRGCDAGVVDQGLGAQCGQSRCERRIGGACARRIAALEFRDLGHRDVQNVEEVAARSAVWARPQRIGRRQRVQGIQADESRAAWRQPSDQLLQIAEIADAPVAPGPHRVQLHREAPQTPAGDDGRRLVAQRRGYDEQAAVRLAARQPCIELMIPRGQFPRQLEAAARHPRSFRLAAPLLRTGGRGHAALVQRAVLEQQRPDQAGAEVTRRDIDVEGDARALRGHHGRQQTA